jgi:hypothetical protein
MIITLSAGSALKYREETGNGSCSSPVTLCVNFFIISKNGISDTCYCEMHENPAIIIQIFPL